RRELTQTSGTPAGSRAHVHELLGRGRRGQPQPHLRRAALPLRPGGRPAAGHAGRRLGHEQLPPPPRAGRSLGPPLALGPASSRERAPDFSRSLEQVNAYELTIHGLDAPASFATARWELFIFPEVQALAPGSAKDRFVVFYEGDSADPTA